MDHMPDCCKKAQSHGETPEVAMARVCCNLNCSEPGTGGSNVSSFSPQQGTVPSAAPVVLAAPASRLQSSNLYQFEDHAYHSNPKYIQHLALLI
jgi:hypothetical protein